MKKTIGILIVIAIIIGGIFWYINRVETTTVATVSGYKDSTYLIQGEQVTLINGKAETAVSGSSSKNVTQYFGNLAEGDLNSDGRPDAVFFLTQSGTGSGTFYYAVAAIKNSDNTYKGTNAVFLGDRIAPQTIEIKNSSITVNYSDRKPNEPMTTSPSVGKTMYLRVVGSSLEEVAPANITYKNATSNNIVVDLPFPGAVVGKDFTITGKARGTWYFEASFPVKVLDKDGKVLFLGPAQAQTDWMTENFVSFKLPVKVSQSYIGSATIVLEKDNPSALPENDASISFPVTIEY